MTHTSQKNRIIFIDLMRALAVLMMVQGHTVDVLLSNDHRLPGSPFFSIWLFMRGMTAPVFMFTAGTVFIYLFRLANLPFRNNPRVIKGLKRFLLLVCIGYLLRYPASFIFDFTNVSEKSWEIFFAVDVLHLIGFGILFLICAAFIAEKLKLPDYFVFISAALFFFLLYPLTNSINWTGFLPRFIAGYFYTGTGSLFPLFPWTGYVLLGGALGSYLAKNPEVFKKPQFSFRLFVIGLMIFSSSFLISSTEKIFYGELAADKSYLEIIFLRTGFVLMLNAAVSYISIRINNIPGIIILIGRNTLLIYVVHLMILYGSAWNPGLNSLFEKSFDVWNTVGTALAMIISMIMMVLIVNRINYLIRLRFKNG